MSQSGFGSGSSTGAGTDMDGSSSHNELPEGAVEGRERGSRRRKLAGYLKAANELRQSYQSSYTSQWGARATDPGDYEDHNIPGAFPDVSIVRHGHEELILFPSYCKRHIKQDPKAQSSSNDKGISGEGSADAEWWRQEWEKLEDDKAIVDVDVRGWLYTPHRGQMSRKNRILIGLARQLSGVPAVPKPDKSQSRENSPDPHLSMKARHEAHEALRDQEKIIQEAEEILRKGQGEEDIAARGGYSEAPNLADFDSDSESIYSERGRAKRSPSRDNIAGPGHLQKRASWNQPSDMNPEQLAAANTNLMARLMPFLTNPLVSTPITIFFYDEKTSQSKTVMTNEAGHFNLRAALDFLPTHIRVLASENLSASVEVKIMEPKGVSLISDVDDTIKHSSIGSGAREIFRNAFIRDLGDLTIDGVKEWYNTLYDMGVGFHYVSNSPWQLFPVLVSFFQAAGLPPGSYHLKQYSGMLQGIFEPVAERKKGTLERIMRDFPERRFLLIGDSGEADLEVYTDVVLANPGRVIGVFIRDVTTPTNQGFFDSAMGPLSGDRQKRKKVLLRGRTGDNSISTTGSSVSEKRPPLPARGKTEVMPQTSDGPAMGKLIDFDDDPEETSVHQSHKRILPRSMSDLALLESSRLPRKVPPQRPSKPVALRSSTADSHMSKSDSPLSQTQNMSEISPSEKGYLSTARGKVASAYNAIPPASSYIPGMSSSPAPAPKRTNAPSSTTSQTGSQPLPPIPPPRRGKAATAAAYASNRLSWNNSTKSADDSDSDSADSTPNFAPVNKKLELWKRRWKRAKDLLSAQGVELRSWREGADVCVDAIQLVEKNMRELGVEGYGEFGSGKGKTGEGGGEAKVKDLKR